MATNASRPLRPEPDDAGHRRGRHIEDGLRTFLLAESRAGKLQLFSQPDVLAIDADGRAFLIEAKGMDYYEAPPFDGHGLPIAQLRRYEQIRTSTGLRTLFMIWDQLGLCLQWLDVLEAGQHHDLPGTIKTPRRIYPLTSFQRRVHDTSRGAPTDEPPPPAPADTDMDAAAPDDSWMDMLNDPLPSERDARKNPCTSCGDPGGFYGNPKLCWPCWNKQPVASGWQWPGHGDC